MHAVKAACAAFTLLFEKDLETMIHSHTYIVFTCVKAAVAHTCKSSLCHRMKSVHLLHRSDFHLQLWIGKQIILKLCRDGSFSY